MRPVAVAILAEGEERERLERTAVESGARIVPPTDADGIVWASLDDPRALLPFLGERVRWVHLWDAGVDAWLERDVIDDERSWTSMRGAYGAPIAEYCLAALLAAARSLPAVTAARDWSPPPVSLLRGATVCVVGAGGIGSALVRLLEPFGANVVAVTRSGRDVGHAAEAIATHRLDDVLARCDYVVIAAPATGDTAQLLSRERLARLKPTAWLVNVARGTLIDSDALLDALRAGHLGGAFLDVTDPEPLPANHALWSLPNVVITAHTAGTVLLCRDALNERVHENVRRLAAGKPLIGLVDREAGY